MTQDSNSKLPDPKKYQEHYKEDAFWNKLSKFALKIGSKGVYYALLLYYIMVDSQTPLSQKALIAGALGYLILPLDVIPDVLLGVGFTDDLGVLYMALQAVQSNLTDEHRNQARERFKSWFPDSSIPDDV